MQTKVLCALLSLIGLNTHAGYLVEKSMYVTNHVVVGRGATVAEARKDALSAIPKLSENLFYEPDSNYNSPVYQCSGEGITWNEKTECQGADIQMTIPLRLISR